MINDRIIVSSDANQAFDKMQIALAIRNSTYEDSLSCSLLENGVLKNCENCTLNYFCKRIDEVAQNYLDKTTTVLNTFSFL
ncbi:hypothetical protein CPJCM30710_30000 [Clostridium polyendosporum]|uniref:Uncharacterized protein n=1 Tax=Clostridium polyendosporum TaxID=69208 RepID=A0A919S2M4_9CLOT|nr:hypothetical protein [Clostridium polyendosporum]GIM30334.1 hypothetical protein CPJCM30710_30000 [Clostridium polyendosporum]